MSKQKIREWLEKQNPLWLEIASKGDIIHQYTKDQRGWVSIKEKLPEPNQKILTASKDGRIFYTMFSKGQFKHSFKCILSVHDHDNVTHWMPLPESPK